MQKSSPHSLAKLICSNSERNCDRFLRPAKYISARFEQNIFRFLRTLQNCVKGRKGRSRWVDGHGKCLSYLYDEFGRPVKGHSMEPLW